MAKKYLSREHQVFEGLLSKLEQDSQEAHRAKKEALHLREEAERLKKEWVSRTEASVNDLLDKTRQKLRRVLEQAQDEVRAVVRKLDDQRHNQSRREIDNTRSKLNEVLKISASQIESALEEEAPALAEKLTLKETEVKIPETPTNLKPGGTVRISKWKSTGTILEVRGTKIRVSVGTMQMTLSLHEIESIAPPPSKARTFASISAPASTPDPQIDLRGVRFDEAMSALEQYLDEAFRSGAFVEVTVIHGLGTGALREGAHKLLGRLPYVKSFRNGGAGHGGTGATIVELKGTP